MEERNLRKVMIGTVTSNKMDKTVVVSVETSVKMCDCVLSGMAVVSGKKTAAGQRASVSAARLQCCDSCIRRKSNQSGKECDDPAQDV